MSPPDMAKREISVRAEAALRPLDVCDRHSFGTDQRLGFRIGAVVGNNDLSYRMMRGCNRSKGHPQVFRAVPRADTYGEAVSQFAHNDAFRF